MWGDVHVISIGTAASVVYGEDGKRTFTATTTSVIDARMTGGNQRELAEYAQRGIVVDAVALIANFVEVPTESGVVDITCVVDCDDDELHPALRGQFRVTDVRPNLDHTRLILTRTDRR